MSQGQWCKPKNMDKGKMVAKDNVCIQNKYNENLCMF